uniref:Uncharacterized protein n=1 Tax=Oryza punctata TaxID=4537 RepID=A0A0E0M567_ORYPU
MVQQQHAAAGEHRLQKAAKVNTSWDSCITEHGSPADSSSPTILSFGGHAAATAVVFAINAQAQRASYYGAAAVAALKPKQDVDEAVAPSPTHARPSGDMMTWRQDPTKHLIERAIMPRSKVSAGGGGGRKQPVTVERRRRGKGVVHASSSRHRWMHPDLGSK